ncbi:MAG: hypothetical protein EBX92_05300 [Actinobacteria bacterium]|nr:hypothetical protein [Actinomycetota bacterium]
MKLKSVLVSLFFGTSAIWFTGIAATHAADKLVNCVVVKSADLNSFFGSPAYELKVLNSWLGKTDRLELTQSLTELSRF